MRRTIPFDIRGRKGDESGDVHGEGGGAGGRGGRRRMISSGRGVGGGDCRLFCARRWDSRVYADGGGMYSGKDMDGVVRVVGVCIFIEGCGWLKWIERMATRRG